MASILLCPHYPACSGCSSIGTAYDRQLEAKLHAVRALFEQALLPGFDPAVIRGIAPSPRLSGYRNRSKLVPASDTPHLPVAMPVRLGLYRAGTHDVVDIPGCPVHSEGINRAIEAARAVIGEFDVVLYDETTHKGDLRFLTVREGFATSELLIGFVTGVGDHPYWEDLGASVLQRCEGAIGVVRNINPGPGNVIFGKTTRVLAGRHYLEEIVCGVRIQLGITSFFQVNTAVAKIAYEAIMAQLDLTPEDTLLDLYAGVGVIGLIAAGRVKRVFAVEASPEAVKFAISASRLNGVKNIEFLQSSVESCLPSLMKELKDDRKAGGRVIVVLNPPRGGVDPQVIEILTGAMPARIAYLSCSPTTLLRDLARLSGGGYRVRHVELFDMFPQTEEVETLAVLEPQSTPLPKPLRRVHIQHRRGQ